MQSNFYYFSSIELILSQWMIWIVSAIFVILQIAELGIPAAFLCLGIY